MVILFLYVHSYSTTDSNFKLTIGIHVRNTLIKLIIRKKLCCHQCSIPITRSHKQCLTNVHKQFSVFMNHYEITVFIINYSLERTCNVVKCKICL